MDKEAIIISRKKLAKLANDTEKSATAVNLLYISDEVEGITRKRKGKNFAYYLEGKKITDETILSRIKSLVLPLAWEGVWICSDPRGHLQATGYDARGRKQYKYHPLWVALRNHTKFYRMYDFGKALPAIREHLASDLRKKGLPPEKVLAAVVAVMQYTNVRVGNSSYEKEYGSYGLTTLKDKHAIISGGKVKFAFKGKKGVQQEVMLNNRKLARIVQQCRDIPGKELFQYYDEDGKHYAVDSGMVNNYIRQVSGDNFTAKDFRTWFGSLRALQHLKEAGCCNTGKERQKKIIEAIDAVARHLGNTRAVCRKYYIHPAILDQYTENKLDDFFSDRRPEEIAEHGLNNDEKALMSLLEMQAKIPVTGE